MADALDPAQSITILGYQVWDEGIEEINLDISNPRCVRVLVLDWTDIPGFLSAAGGGYDQKLAGYTSPLAHPLYPVLTAKYGSYVGIPVGGMTNDANNLAAYRYGRVKLAYGRTQFDVSSFNIIPQGDVRIKSRTEIDVPKSVDSTGTRLPIWKFSDGSTVPATLNPGIRIPSGVVEVVRYNCSTTGQTLQAAIGGMVNKEAFLGCAAETLLFDGITSSKQITLGGSNNWTISFALLYRGIGWNTFFNPNATGTNIWKRYQKIKLSSDNTTTPFPLGDFNQIAASVV